MQEKHLKSKYVLLDDYSISWKNSYYDEVGTGPGSDLKQQREWFNRVGLLLADGIEPFNWKVTHKYIIGTLEQTSTGDVSIDWDNTACETFADGDEHVEFVVLHVVWIYCVLVGSEFVDGDCVVILGVWGLTCDIDLNAWLFVAESWKESYLLGLSIRRDRLRRSCRRCGFRLRDMVDICGVCGGWKRDFGLGRCVVCTCRNSNVDNWIWRIFDRSWRVVDRSWSICCRSAIGWRHCIINNWGACIVGYWWACIGRRNCRIWWRNCSFVADRRRLLVLFDRLDPNISNSDHSFSHNFNAKPHNIIIMHNFPTKNFHPRHCLLKTVAASSPLVGQVNIGQSHDLHLVQFYYYSSWLSWLPLWRGVI